VAVATTAPGASHHLDPYFGLYFAAYLVGGVGVYLVSEVHCSPSPALRWLPHQSTQLYKPFHASMVE
jgi:hypothetical protein